MLGMRIQCFDTHPGQDLSSESVTVKEIERPLGRVEFTQFAYDDPIRPTHVWGTVVKALLYVFAAVSSTCMECEDDRHPGPGDHAGRAGTMIAFEQNSEAGLKVEIDYQRLTKTRVRFGKCYSHLFGAGVNLVRIPQLDLIRANQEYWQLVATIAYAL